MKSESSITGILIKGENLETDRQTGAHTHTHIQDHVNIKTDSKVVVRKPRKAKEAQKTTRRHGPDLCP